MKTYKVFDSQVVVVLSKDEAKFLLRGFATNYFQNNKTKARIVDKLAAALTEVLGTLCKPQE
jgi:hypothetical protein